MAARGFELAWEVVMSMRNVLQVMGVFVVMVMVGRVGWGMIEFSTGNAPVGEGSWPVGVLAVANLPTRVVHWDGPLGGAEHFGYRGNTEAFQAALDLFGKVKAPELRMVVREEREELSFLRADGKAD